MAQVIVAIDTLNLPVYGAEALAYFQQVPEEMMDRDLNGAPLPADQERVLKTRLVAALSRIEPGSETECS